MCYNGGNLKKGEAMLLTLQNFGLADKKIVNLPVLNKEKRNRYQHYILRDTADENAKFLVNMSFSAWLNVKKRIDGYIAVVIYNLDGSFYLSHNAEKGDPYLIITEKMDADYYCKEEHIKSLGYENNLDFLSVYLPMVAHVDAYAVYQQIPAEAGTQRFRTVHKYPTDKI